MILEALNFLYERFFMNKFSTCVRFLLFIGVASTAAELIASGDGYDGVGAPKKALSAAPNSQTTDLLKTRLIEVEYRLAPVLDEYHHHLSGGGPAMIPDDIKASYDCLTRERDFLILLLEKNHQHEEENILLAIKQRLECLQDEAAALSRMLQQVDQSAGQHAAAAAPSY